jgi:hypothetical protein
MLRTGPKFHVHHSSFEVQDFDIQALGHQWLRDKGYDLVWGELHRLALVCAHSHWSGRRGTTCDGFTDF